MCRLFVAIDFPNEIKERLLKLCFGIPNARWATKEQLHLTLKFIGEIDGGDIDSIIKTLSSIEMKSFNIVLEGIGHFPPKKNPKIIWVGVSENEKLCILQKKIDRNLFQIGILPDTRKFHAHITLARLDDNPSTQKISVFMNENAFLKSPPIAINEFTLYRSFISPKGSIYEKITEFKLTQA